MLQTMVRRRTMMIIASLSTLVLADAVLADAAVHVVSQRRRMFDPDAITIARGDTLRLVNDDGDLLHHAYIKTKDFSYDSGDQEPGSKSDVLFTKAGTFTILCGIHPKMKMTVTVKD